jgi:transcription antitermination factor NusG
MVQFWEWGTGKLRPARIVSMKDSQVTLLDEQSQHRISVSYAAILLEQEQTGASGSHTPGSTANAPLQPPPEVRRKEDFRVGQKVSFSDQSLKRHVGQITRINQRTATVHCDGRAWRISFALLQHVVDVSA